MAAFVYECTSRKNGVSINGGWLGYLEGAAIRPGGKCRERQYVLFRFCK